MCGKFTMMVSWREVRDLSEIAAQAGAAGDQVEIGTPMRMVPVIHLGDDGRRIAEPMRWGFADLRSRTPLDKPKHMHARAETIDKLPTFAGAFAAARGIVLAKTFNIGEELPNGKIKQWVISSRDGKPIPLAVIWEKWSNRDGDTLLTFCMVTAAANKLIAPKDDRMPAVIPAEHWGAWLGETEASIAEVKALLAPYEGDWDMAEQPAPPKLRRPSSRPAEPTLW